MVSDEMFDIRDNCSHSIFYRSCPSCLRARIAELEEEMDAELAMKRVYIQQITTLEAALKEVVDAADGEGWGQLDPSLKKTKSGFGESKQSALVEWTPSRARSKDR